MVAIDWIVPLSLGDSHRGFRVLGADVAAQLGYDLGDPAVVAHSLASFALHDDLYGVAAEKAEDSQGTITGLPWSEAYYHARRQGRAAALAQGEAVGG